MEGRHGTLECRDVNCNRYRTASLALVATSSWHIEAQVVAILVQVHVSWSSKMVGLRCRTLDEWRGHRSRHGEAAVIISQAVLERLQRYKLGKLNAQDLGMASQVMNHDLTSLLLLGEITALVESSGVRRVHVKVRRAVQLHNKTTWSRWFPIRPRARIPSFQGDVLDIGKRILDLIAGSIVVDIVSHACLIRGIENDQVHGVLSNAPPAADSQGTTGEVRNY